MYVSIRYIRYTTIQTAIQYVSKYTDVYVNVTKRFFYISIYDYVDDNWTQNNSLYWPL